MSHPCPRTGCPVTSVEDSKLMCRMCWSVVPKPLQRAVNAAYGRGRGLGSTALIAAQRSAIAAAERALGITRGAAPETT
jgi:hypothetical protein